MRLAISWPKTCTYRVCQARCRNAGTPQIHRGKAYKLGETNRPFNQATGSSSSTPVCLLQSQLTTYLRREGWTTRGMIGHRTMRGAQQAHAVHYLHRTHCLMSPLPPPPCWRSLPSLHDGGEQSNLVHRRRLKLCSAAWRLATVCACAGSRRTLQWRCMVRPSPTMYAPALACL